jgi:hypothetical protein
MELRRSKRLGSHFRKQTKLRSNAGDARVGPELRDVRIQLRCKGGAVDRDFGQVLGETSQIKHRALWRGPLGVFFGKAGRGARNNLPLKIVQKPRPSLGTWLPRCKRRGRTRRATFGSQALRWRALRPSKQETLRYSSPANKPKRFKEPARTTNPDPGVTQKKQSTNTANSPDFRPSPRGQLRLAE